MTPAKYSIIFVKITIALALLPGGTSALIQSRFDR